MSKQRRLSPQSVWDTGALLQAFEEHGIKNIHAVKIWSTLIRNPSAQWSDVPDLPKAACEFLDKYFVKFTTRVVDCKTSADGQTSKLLLELQDGQQVEAVIMHYDTTGRYTEADEPACSSASSSVSTAQGRGHRRATLCVSSQVGCQMGCTFCATGTMGLKGNLTSGEILEQLVHANAVSRIRNIVFMGMGEPLNNYEPVKAAIGMMTDSRLFSLSRRHVTVSTVGIIPRIKQLAEDLPGVSLALSLHAPNQELRQQIVPSARAYKLDRLMEAVLHYQRSSGLRVFVEYVMLAEVNDGEAEAHQLGELLQGHDMLINLIPWNPVYSAEGPKFNAPSDQSVLKFKAVLQSQYNMPCTIRQEKGQDISGACGQLVIEHAAAGGAGSAGQCGTQASAGGSGCGSKPDAYSGLAAGSSSKAVKDIEDTLSGAVRVS